MMLICTSVQADLSLHYLRKMYFTFSHVMALIINTVEPGHHCALGWYFLQVKDTQRAVNFTFIPTLKSVPFNREALSVSLVK